MRFLADENVSRLVAASQRRFRRDFSRGNELGSFGQRLGVRGVVLLELDSLSNAPEANHVAAAVSANAEMLAGSLIVIEPGRIRIRPLSR